MNKIVVSTFDSERAAFEGVSALKDLHHTGDITLYASSVVAKDGQGNMTVRQAADQGPVGTLVGLVTGGLVGVIAGPAGFAVGAYLGGFGGLMHDLFKAGVSADFVDAASAAVAPGKTAIVAEIDETWVTPVDTRLEALGGTTIRRLPGEVVDEQLVRESEATRREMEELNAELRETSRETRARVEASIEQQRGKLNALVARVDETLGRQKAELDARLHTLKAQREQAADRRREQIDARIEELNASHAARRTKLQEARRLASESVEMTVEALVP